MAGLLIQLGDKFKGGDERAFALEGGKRRRHRIEENTVLED
jgi:hypothetical protein